MKVVLEVHVHFAEIKGGDGRKIKQTNGGAKKPECEGSQTKGGKGKGKTGKDKSQSQRGQGREKRGQRLGRSGRRQESGEVGPLGEALRKWRRKGNPEEKECLARRKEETNQGGLLK